MCHIIWALTRENLSSGVCEQHPCRLISAFVLRLLESIISKLATSEISLFYLVSVAEETGLSLALWQTREDRFSRNEAHILVASLSLMALF